MSLNKLKLLNEQISDKKIYTLKKNKKSEELNISNEKFIRIKIKRDGDCLY